MNLRLVHDPDTGCISCVFSGWWHPDDGPAEGKCWAAKRDVLVPVPYRDPAPPWCPLRAGDVVVTAGKDGG